MLLGRRLEDARFACRCLPLLVAVGPLDPVDLHPSVVRPKAHSLPHLHTTATTQRKITPHSTQIVGHPHGRSNVDHHADDDTSSHIGSLPSGPPTLSKRIRTYGWLAKVTERGGVCARGADPVDGFDDGAVPEAVDVGKTRLQHLYPLPPPSVTYLARRVCGVAYAWEGAVRMDVGKAGRSTLPVGLPPSRRSFAMARPSLSATYTHPPAPAPVSCALDM